ncbi:MAG: ABC transporter permease [Bacteriovoracaceae bacterium]|nr:ABC transporter permease [Bacteriovoracaceae bacterium]
MNIWQYVLKRLLYVIPILLGVCLLVFILFNVVAGDPTVAMLGKHATLEQMNELRHQLGLDRAWYYQYFDIVKSVFTFDFGRSWSTKQQISEMLANGIGPSMTLTLPAFMLAVTVSISLSLVVAFFRGRFIDKFFVFLCIVMMSVSSLVYILFGQKFLAYDLGLFEISGYEYGFPYFIPYVLLPMLIWLMMSLGPDLRFYRTVILDEIYQDYVRTGRAKGLSERKLMFKHVLKNAMIPIITNVIIQIPFLILGSLLMERFFGIPGVGSITVDAINSSDFPVIKAMTVIISVMYIFFNVLTDVLYTVVDPRVRLK